MVTIAVPDSLRGFFSSGVIGVYCPKCKCEAEFVTVEGISVLEVYHDDNCEWNRAREMTARVFE